MSGVTIQLSHEEYQRLAKALKIKSSDYENRPVTGYIMQILMARQALGMSLQPEFLISDYDPLKYNNDIS